MSDWKYTIQNGITSTEWNEKKQVQIKTLDKNTGEQVLNIIKNNPDKLWPKHKKAYRGFTTKDFTLIFNAAVDAKLFRDVIEKIRAEKPAPQSGAPAPQSGTPAPTGGTPAPTGGTSAPTGGTPAPTGGASANDATNNSILYISLGLFALVLVIAVIWKMRK